MKKIDMKWNRKRKQSKVEQSRVEQSRVEQKGEKKINVNEKKKSVRQRWELENRKLEKYLMMTRDVQAFNRTK